MHDCQQKQGGPPANGRVRVLFLAVNASYSHRSLASWCLRSMLDEAAVDWCHVDVSINDAPDGVAERVLEQGPDVVAATLYIFNTEYVRGVFAQIRQKMPDCILVIGGPECLGDNKSLVPSIADVAFRGEGELALAAWLGCLRQRESWTSIPGACGMSGGVYVDRGSCAMVQSLDELPRFYPDMLAGRKFTFVQMETSRGCPNGCLFCTSRRTRMRYKSLDRVREDLADIHASGVRDVRLVDRTFNLEEKRSLQLLEIFRCAYPDTRFHLEIDPVRVSPALLRAFAEAPAGQLHLEMGVQSLETSAYALLDRRGNPEDAMASVTRVCQVGGVRVHVDLMAGLPGQTLAGLLADVVRIVLSGPAEIQLERLKALPGTPFMMEPQHWGLTFSGLPPYAVQSSRSMSDVDLDVADHVARILDWFHNKAVLRGVFVTGIRRHPDLLLPYVEHFRGLHPSPICPSLEHRLRAAMSFWEPRDELIFNDVRYAWYRNGLSMKQGPCQVEPWKRKVPSGAMLVEGGAGVVSRVWRVGLHVPYYFCFGSGPAGGRALIAVYRES